MEAHRQQIEPAMFRLREAYAKEEVAEEEFVEAQRLLTKIVEETHPDRMVAIALIMAKHGPLPSSPLDLIDPKAEYRRRLPRGRP